MLGKSKDNALNYGREASSVQQMPRSAVASRAAPEVSSISAGLSIIGKIVGHGAVTIFGHVDGEVRASTVVIAEGAQVEGDIVAEELTIGGQVNAGTEILGELFLDRPGRREAGGRSIFD